jgi:hypothetical protein
MERANYVEEFKGKPEVAFLLLHSFCFFFFFFSLFHSSSLKKKKKKKKSDQHKYGA